MESETIYTLTREFSFQDSQGGNSQATSITMFEPTNDVLAEQGKIRKWLAAAQRSNRERLIESGVLDKDGNPIAINDQVEDSDQEQTADDADGRYSAANVIWLLSESDIPVDEFYLTVAAILQRKGFAKVNNDSQLTPSLWRKIRGEDCELVIGQYVAAFFIR